MQLNKFICPYGEEVNTMPSQGVIREFKPRYGFQCFKNREMYVHVVKRLTQCPFKARFAGSNPVMDTNLNVISGSMVPGSPLRRR